MLDFGKKRFSKRSKYFRISVVEHSRIEVEHFEHHHYHSITRISKYINIDYHKLTSPQTNSLKIEMNDWAQNFYNRNFSVE